jgi:Uma2 family endonuclease
MIRAMSEPAAKPGRRYTWSEYRTWNDDKRWEIIGGELFLMSSPTSRHQIITMELSVRLHSFFKDKGCKVFAAPMDVVLSDEDVVQPDHLVVCDSRLIKRTHIEGPPSLIVEIVSPDSGLRDRMRKLNLYARSGVKEYWIVTPWPSTIELLLLHGQKYMVHQVFSKDDILVSATFPDLHVTLGDIFNFPLEPGEEPPVIQEPPAPRYAATH